MRSAEQRKFVQLFGFQEDREPQSKSAESPVELSHAVLSLAKSIEILASAFQRAHAEGALFERTGCLALVHADMVARSLELG